MTHGVLDSSDAWIMNTKENSMGFILADAGYDVWLANFRGNKYSNKHTTLDSKNDYEYWDHTVSSDMGKYDMPAFLDYTTNYSNVKKVTTISHSNGTHV